MHLSRSLAWIRRNLVTTILALAYLAMSLLIFEQGRVIDNQRALIQDLYGDSVALNAMKAHALQGLEQQRKAEPKR